MKIKLINTIEEKGLKIDILVNEKGNPLFINYLEIKNKTKVI